MPSLRDIVDSWLVSVRLAESGDGELTPELADTLAGNEAELADKVNSCLWAAQMLEGDAATYRERARAIAARASSAEHHAERIREYVGQELDRAEIKRLKTADFSVSRTAGRERITVTDAEALYEYQPDLVEIVYKVDKRALAEKFDKGGTFAGIKVEIGPPGLMVR